MAINNLSPIRLREQASASSSTWNPSDKGGNVVLSNGNLTATKAGANYESVRGVNGKSSGKRYFQITATNSSILIAGVADSGFALTVRYVGEAQPTAKKSAGWWGAGFFFYNLTNAASNVGVTTYGSGSVLGIGVDFTTFTITLYNGATGALIYTYVDATPWPTLYPAASLQTNGSGTLNALGPFTHLPSGFVVWDSP